VAVGPVHEVLSAGRAAGLLVRLDDVATGLRILGEAGIEARLDDGLVKVRLPPAEAARVTRTLADRGLYLTELRADEADLETVFLELTGDASTEGTR
jgi:ABC-2 type transport system ATP-binding protein